jgi:NAD-dependent SIR2 family protein deacetylase
MPKLYIIGAGCSRNYTEGTTRVPGLASPLDRDFFVMAKKVILHGKIDPTLALMLDSLLFDLYRLYGYLPPERNVDHSTLLNEEGLRLLDDPHLGLESVMTAISLENELFMKLPCLFGYREPSTYLPTQLAPLLELIANTISEALLGPPCSKHRKLAESLGRGDIVISYNYDTLMDNALRNCGKLSDNGYLLPFEKVSSSGTWERPDDKASEITLLKLHGSLNWMRCTNCDSNLMMRYEKMGRWETSIPKICPKCGLSGGYLERLIVPPLLTKDYSDHAINYLWREASMRISRNVHEIVAIGYSLPATDFASETLLRTGLGFSRQKEIPLTLVNPDEKALDRFSKIFAPSKITWIKSVDEYLATL